MTQATRQRPWVRPNLSERSDVEDCIIPDRECKQCGATKPLTSEFFAPEKQCRDGFRPICRVCVKEQARLGSIYAITLMLDGRQYVGSSGTTKRRWAGHRSDLRGNRHHSPQLQAAWNKYGEENFSFDIIEPIDLPMHFTDAEIEDALLPREQAWIDKLNPVFNTCLVAGTRRGVQFTPEQLERLTVANQGKNLGKKNALGTRRTLEQKARMSEAQKGHPTSDEARAKQSLAHQGNQYRLGKTHTEETKAKISKSKKGQRLSPEVYAQQGAARMGHEVTEETREKIRTANTGNTHSEESKEIMRQKRITWWAEKKAAAENDE